jgi:hypothetical protein
MSFFKVLVLIGLVSTGLLVAVINDDQEVILESQESKTVLGGPVFNKIKWFKYPDKDVWMMNQSHHGSQVSANGWDRLAIVVDKTKSSKTARFYQLEPGPLEWKDNPPEKAFKVSCFMCHNNGPRVIRPNYDSPFDPTDLKDKVKIGYWNLQIKLYGRVLTDEIHDQGDIAASPPFRFRGDYENEPVKVATCVKCHKETGFFARGLLSRQQMPTIKFMLETGQMPPLGFSMSSNEKKELELFLDGF